MNLVANEIHFLIAWVFQKGMKCSYIHVLLDELWKYSCPTGKPFSSIYVYSYLIGTLSTQSFKIVTFHWVKSGRWYGPRHCN